MSPVSVCNKSSQRCVVTGDKVCVTNDLLDPHITSESQSNTATWPQPSLAPGQAENKVTGVNSHQITHSPEIYHFLKQKGKIQLLASSYSNILKITFISIDWQPYNLVHELLHFGYKITNLVKFEYTKLHNTEDLFLLDSN